MQQTHDIIVLGGGAAGLMCAAVAGQRGRRVVVLERAEDVGRKIIISGGGRCNFTNLHTAPDRYISANRHFAKSALARYTARDFIALIESYGIAWHEKTLGQLFCDGSARQIVDMLLAECAVGGVEVRCGVAITGADHADSLFRIATEHGSLCAPALVIATGGPSIPKLGATGFAYELARRFRLKVVEPRPALVPLSLGGDELLFRELAGVSTEVIACHGKAAFREAALFTHRGLSGPAILQVSSYWTNGEEIGIDLFPDRAPGWLVEAKRMSPQATVRSSLRDALPARLGEALADRIGLTGDLGNTPDAALRDAGTRLANWRFRPTGSEGFAKAEVTVGGISTAELSSRTMGAKRVPGLYVIGEAMDVTGWLGGYNFQWAWASAVAAAQAL